MTLFVKSVMIDTVHIWVPANEIEGEDWLEVFAESLEGGKRFEKANGYRSAFGHIGNLRVRIGERGVKIEGSLPKFVLGNNFEIPEIADVADFITNVEDALPGIDLRRGKITRLDFGANITCNHPVKAYLLFFSVAKYFEKHAYQDGIHYRNGNRQIILYDKKAEAKAKGGEIPAIFQDKHLLRVEARLMKPSSIKKYLGQKNHVPMLEMPSVWERMKETCMDFYFSIGREREIFFDPESITKPKELTDWLVSMGVMKIGGIEQIEKYLDLLKLEDAFPNQAYYSRSRKKITSIFEKSSHAKTLSVLDELDRSVKKVFDAQKSARTKP